MSCWDDDLRKKLATEKERAKARHCDDTKHEARVEYIGGLLEKYEEMLDKAESYGGNEEYVNVRVAVLGDILECLEADDTIWEAS